MGSLIGCLHLPKVNARESISKIHLASDMVGKYLIKTYLPPLIVLKQSTFLARSMVCKRYHLLLQDRQRQKQGALSKGTQSQSDSFGCLQTRTQLKPMPHVLTVERQRKGESGKGVGEIKTLICYSAYSCLRWLIPAYALTGDRNPDLRASQTML